jgi:transcriptional regulator with XRE-family HTH domain
MATPKLKTIGARIKHARLEEGLSQKELAKKVQLSDKAISSYEVDRAEPSYDMLKKIGKAINRPVRYFLDEASQEEVDLKTKLAKIEQELAEVKKLLMMK